MVLKCISSETGFFSVQIILNERDNFLPPQIKYLINYPLFESGLFPHKYFRHILLFKRLTYFQGENCIYSSSLF